MTGYKPGDLAAVGCMVDSDGTCTECQAGLEQFCPSMTLTYNSTDPSAPGSVDVDIDVKRAIRFRAGASVSLGFLRLFGDAAFGAVTSYAAGLRLGF